MDHVVIDPQKFGVVQLKASTSMVMDEIVFRDEMMPAVGLIAYTVARIGHGVAIDLKAINDCPSCLRHNEIVKTGAGIDPRRRSGMNALRGIDRRIVSAARIDSAQNGITRC